MSLLSDVEFGIFESGGKNHSESYALSHKTPRSKQKFNTVFVP